MPIEKDIIYIKLANFLFVIELNTKHITDSDGIYHWTKGIMKVNTWLLVKAFSNKLSFVPCNKVVRISFDAKHPFFAH